MTLSPFNIALAFNAPLLAGVSSSSGTRGIDRTIGDTRIKYGFVGTESHGDMQSGNFAAGRLGFERYGHVVRPREGMRFSG